MKFIISMVHWTYVKLKLRWSEHIENAYIVATIATGYVANEALYQI